MTNTAETAYEPITRLAFRSGFLIIRTRGEPRAVIGGVRAALAALVIAPLAWMAAASLMPRGDAQSFPPPWLPTTRMTAKPDNAAKINCRAVLSTIVLSRATLVATSATAQKTPARSPIHSQALDGSGHRPAMPHEEAPGERFPPAAGVVRGQICLAHQQAEIDSPYGEDRGRPPDGGAGVAPPARRRVHKLSREAVTRYLPELQKLLGELRRQAALKSQEATAGIGAAIDPLLPAERLEETLSRKALWVVASTPGVTSVLNGMRTPSYVDDALGILSWPRLKDPVAVYEALRERKT